MSQSILIETPTPAAAAALHRDLAARFERTVSLEGVRVVLQPDRPPDRFVVDVLDAVKAWVEADGAELVHVILDGRRYALSADRQPVETPS